MMKMNAMVLILGLLLVGSVSAVSIDYYYHPQCVHCQNIAPFIEDVIKTYDNVEWNIFDTSKEYFDGGTPTLFINTDDGRNIKMVGSYEIPTYLQCELDEQSNLNCPTYSANECRDDSWFIK